MKPASILTRCLLLALLLIFAQVTKAFADRKLDEELLSWCGYGNVERVADLLKQGANPNAKNEFGVSALHLALRNGKTKLIRLLIKSGAKVNVKDRSGVTPLVNAAGSNRADAVKVLLDAGAEPSPDALGMACITGNVDAARLLLERRIAPDAGLLSAAQNRHVELVKLLLNKGANVNYRSKSSNTALHVAALQGGPDTVRLLLKKGADPNLTNKNNETPLHLAIVGDGDIEVIKLLLAAGAKTNIADQEVATPVRLAGMRGMKEAYDVLLNASGGKEPAPERTKQAKSTKQLINELASDKAGVRIAAQRDLASRGKEVMPEILQSINSGTEIERFYELFAAMGPNADAALPKLKAELGDKKHTASALLTLEQMKPGAIVALDDDTKQKAAEALYEPIVDPKTDVAVGIHIRLLLRLDEPAVPTILHLLRHEDPRIRALMARELERASLSNKAIRDELMKLQSEDKSPEVRAKAARGLRNPNFRSADAKQALIERLRTPPIPIESLPSKSGPEREAAFAKKRAIDEMLDETARSLASYGPEMVDELLPLIRTNGGDPAWQQYKKVWDNLGTDAVPKFRTLLDNSDERIRGTAYQELGRLAATSPEALSILTARLESAEPQQRQLAADALWDIHGISAKPIRSKLLHAFERRRH